MRLSARCHGGGGGGDGGGGGRGQVEAANKVPDGVGST
jgi:hypothetical protein